MIKREAKFAILFRHWLKTKQLGCSVFELKQTQTESILFSKVADHQIQFLLASNSNNGMIYKIPDDSRGIKPFDMFMMQGANAYVVIRYPKLFVLIKIEDFILEKQESMRKSLTQERAVEIAHRVESL